MEFEIKGVQYRTEKLSVFDQLKVSRKLLPVLAGMLADFQSLRAASQGGDMARAMETVLPKIADAVASMSDDDTNAVIHPCLAVVSRRHGKDAWVPVFSDGELAFDDIDLMSMLQLVGRVVGDSLGNFLPASPASVTEGQQPQG
ncbi:phage tail assembly chaperone [Superficieibacter sp. BNK-5]|uniref:phage tail assembly chaperone n=1 Tax=Superficieibacter sp. BNK-5 TaxID=3376142 RepID=UPI0039BF7702